MSWPTDDSPVRQAVALLWRQKGATAPKYRHAGYGSLSGLLYRAAFALGVGGAVSLYVLLSFARPRLLVHRVGNMLVEDHSEHIFDALTAEGQPETRDTAWFKRPLMAIWRHGGEVAALTRACKPHDARELELLVNTFRFFKSFDEYLGAGSHLPSAIVCDDITPRSAGLIAAVRHHGGRSALFLIPGGDVRYLAESVQLFDVVLCTTPVEAQFYGRFVRRIAYSPITARVRFEHGASEKLRIGLLLSSSYFESAAETRQRADRTIETCERLCRLYAAESVYVRAHPGDRVIAQHLGASRCIEIAPADEPFRVFAEKVKLVFAGNTSGIVRVLSRGTPVVYLDGLDRYGHDFFGYVRDGLAIAGTERIPTVAEIAAFYACKAAPDPTLGAVAEHVLSRAAALAYVRGAPNCA
jgi:hypothetical protein